MPTQDPPVQDSTFENKLDELISAVTPNVPGFVSDAHDPTDTYAVGDYAIHENILYRCTTAISTPEAWNSAHWTPTNCANELSQLKTDLDGKVNFHLITASEGYGSNASKTAIRNYCDSITSKVPVMYTLDAGSIGFGYMYKASSNYALIVYYQYGNGTMVQAAMTKYGGTWSDWFNI